MHEEEDFGGLWLPSLSTTYSWLRGGQGTQRGQRLHHHKLMNFKKFIFNYTMTAFNVIPWPFEDLSYMRAWWYFGIFLFDTYVNLPPKNFICYIEKVKQKEKKNLRLLNRTQTESTKRCGRKKKYSEKLRQPKEQALGTWIKSIRFRESRIFYILCTLIQMAGNVKTKELLVYNS